MAAAARAFGLRSAFVSHFPLPDLAVNAITLFAALIAFGAMAAANDVAMNAQAVSVERFLGSRTMSRFHAMFSAGGIVGAGGLIASRGIEPRWYFVVAAAVFVAASAMTLAGLMEARPEARRSASRVRLAAIPVSLLLVCVIGFCILLSDGAIADRTAVYLRQILRATPGMAANGYAVFSALMTIFRLLGDAITNRIGLEATIRAGGFLAAAGLTSSLLAHSPAWALPGFALVGAGLSSIIPLVFAAGGRISGVGEGAGVAAVSGLGYLGFLVGPPVIGGIAQVSSLRTGLFLVVALSAAAALLAGPVQERNPQTFGS